MLALGFAVHGAASADDFGWNRVPPPVLVVPGYSPYAVPWGMPWPYAVPSYPAYPATSLWSDGDLEWRFGTAPDGGWRTDYQWRNSGPHVHGYSFR